MVSGRIYSLVGATDLDSLLHAQLLVLAAISRGDWQPSARTKRKLTDWVEHDYVSAERVRRWADEFLRVELEDRWNAALTEMLAKISPQLNLQVARGRATEGMAAVRKHVEDERLRALRDAPIEMDRLVEIAKYASAKAFSSAEGWFPLGLFREIRSTPEVLRPFTLRSPTNKGELTAQEFNQRVSNEGEYWTRTLQDLVGWVTMQDVVEQLAPGKIETNDEAKYWEQIQVAASAIQKDGQQPIVILENATLPDWVWDWRHPRKGASEDRRISRESDMPDGYEFTLNDIRFFTGRGLSGCSLVTSVEAFDLIEFTRTEADQFVAVEVEPIDKEIEHVRLLATFRRRVHVKPAFSVLLQYGKQVDEVPA